MNTTRKLIPAALVLALAVPACGFLHSSFHHDGVSYEERDGVLYADGTPLRFERWVRVDQPLPAGTTLELSTLSGAIALSAGTAPDRIAIEGHLFSEVENDGALSLDGGKLVAHSTAGHKLAINGVRGTVPPACALDLGSGTGEVSVKGLSGSASVAIETGTSDGLVTDCSLAKLKLDTGTGRMTVQDVRATALRIESGTGDVTLTRCNADELELSSGTGALGASECQFKKSSLELGTGDVQLSHGTSLGEQSLELGTGHVTTLPG